MSLGRQVQSLERQVQFLCDKASAADADTAGVLKTDSSATACMYVTSGGGPSGVSKQKKQKVSDGLEQKKQTLSVPRLTRSASSSSDDSARRNPPYFR